MVRIGDTIYTADQDGEMRALKVTDIAYLNDSDCCVPASEGGKLCYYGEGYGWLSAEEIVGDTDPGDSAFFDQDNRSPGLVDLGYSMLKWHEGQINRPDNDKLPAIFTLLMALQWDKEGGYGSSWKGKGEYRGIMPNIDRKYDRLSNIIDKEISGEREKLPTGSFEQVMEMNIGESKIDAVADLANYCLLYLTYLRERYPGAFMVWVHRNIPEYLRDKISLL